MTAVSTGLESYSYLPTAKDPKWCVAMLEEIDALENNRTGILETLPRGKKLIVANGGTKLSMTPMATLNGTKLSSLFTVTLKLKA